MKSSSLMLLKCFYFGFNSCLLMLYKKKLLFLSGILAP